jgi:phosphoribosylanthranilate isomerase
VLLIVAALHARELRTLMAGAARYGLASLVEVHTTEEARLAIDQGATVIGVNSRNLQTLAVSSLVFEEIAPTLPKGVIRVAESGISTPADVRRVQQLGFHAVLIGERFMVTDDPGASLQAFAGRGVHGGAVVRTRVKVCGITRERDAVAAAKAGADAIGFVFWPGSPRQIAPRQAADSGRTLPAFVTRVGVFVNASPASVARAVRDAALDAVQLHGDEDPRAYRRCGARVIKALPLTSAPDVRKALRYPTDVSVLVDVRDPVRRGGTGRLANWTLAAQLARRRRLSWRAVSARPMSDRPCARCVRGASMCHPALKSRRDEKVPRGSRR